MPIIGIELLKCNNPIDCPFLVTERTVNAGFAYDMYCLINKQKIAGYVEWSRDVPEVPEWCPKKIKKDNEKIPCGAIEEFDSIKAVSPLEG